MKLSVIGLAEMRRSGTGCLEYKNGKTLYNNCKKKRQGKTGFLTNRNMKMEIIQNLLSPYLQTFTPIKQFTEDDF